MEMMTLPLKRTFVRKPGREKCNLNLHKGIKMKGATIARDRYGYSLSELVERLLEEECRLKRGLLTRSK